MADEAEEPAATPDPVLEPEAAGGVPPEEAPPEGEPPTGEAPPEENAPPNEEAAAAAPQPEEKAPPGEAPPEGEVAAPPAEPPSATHQDALSMEFLYYGSVLKVIAPTLTNDPDKALVTPWIKKLFRPEYQTSMLREKRNRYLVALTCNLLNDEVSGIFREKPPDDALVCLKTIHPEPSTAAEWETDRMWQETLLSLPEDFEMMTCSVHGSPDECKQDHRLDKYLLYLTRPYAALLPAEDKTRTAAWLQTLCTIHGDHCSSMKAIRNDYIMALLGYLHDLRIVGPFTEYPPVVLERLDAAAKKSARINPVIDPASPEANQFLLDQPVPDDGAFCYVALTGDLVASSL